MENVLERMKRENSRQQMDEFILKQKQPYEFKVRYAQNLAREFIWECGKDEQGKPFGWAKVLDYIGVEYLRPLEVNINEV